MITVDTEGKLLRWYDDVGAMIEQGDVIAEIQAADGNIPVLAPHAGRLTEMMVLAGDSVQAGQTIGWIDAVDAPQSLGALIDPPAAERKLKPKELKRKPRPPLLPSTARWAIFGVIALVGVGALMVLFVVPVRYVEVPVAITAPPPPLMPTPRFRLYERVLLTDQVGGHTWNEQGIVQNSGYEPDSGTWYEVLFGGDVLRVSESQLGDIAILVPTPTMRHNSRTGDWAYPLVLKEPVADFPAGTRVTIGSAMFNDVEWELSVVTKNGVSLNVRESQLEIPPDASVNVPPTPAARWIPYVGMAGHWLMTNQPIGDIPSNTKVRLITAQFGADGWRYIVVADGLDVEFEVHESQLSPVP